jgi:hypothetical protein
LEDEASSVRPKRNHAPRAPATTIAASAIHRGVRDLDRSVVETGGPGGGTTTGARVATACGERGGGGGGGGGVAGGGAATAVAAPWPSAWPIAAPQVRQNFWPSEISCPFEQRVVGGTGLPQVRQNRSSLVTS